MAIVGLKTPFKKKSSPAKWVQIAAAVLPGLIKGISGMGARRKARKQQAEAQERLEEAKAAYEGIEYKNPYEGIQNPYAENVYEDLTINQQAVDYSTQQTQQQQANIMQGLGGAAGASGIAGLAQSMANIGAQQAQKTAANIATQEQANRELMLQGEQQKQLGGFQTDMMLRKGEMYKRQQEQQRMATLYGLGIDEAEAGDMAVAGANKMIQGGISSMATGLAGTFGTGGELEGSLDKLPRIKLPFGNQRADKIINNRNMNDPRNTGWDDLDEDVYHG